MVGINFCFPPKVISELLQAEYTVWGYCGLQAGEALMADYSRIQGRTHLEEPCLCMCHCSGAPQLCQVLLEMTLH